MRHLLNDDVARVYITMESAPSSHHGTVPVLWAEDTPLSGSFEGRKPPASGSGAAWQKKVSMTASEAAEGSTCLLRSRVRVAVCITRLLLARHVSPRVPTPPWSPDTWRPATSTILKTRKRIEITILKADVVRSEKQNITQKTDT